MTNYYTCDVQNDAFIMELMNDLHDNKQNTFFIQANCSMEPQYYFPSELQSSKLNIDNFNKFNNDIK